MQENTQNTGWAKENLRIPFCASCGSGWVLTKKPFCSKECEQKYGKIGRIALVTKTRERALRTLLYYRHIELKGAEWFQNHITKHDWLVTGSTGAIINTDNKQLNNLPYRLFESYENN